MENIEKTSRLKAYLPYILLSLILLLGAFFRFYRIREYMTFLGDEGRDMLVVKRMIVDHKLTLLGPTTSVGSMYMGPVYYYMMVPFLWAFNLDPVGPSVMVAMLSVLTIYLIYRLVSDYFSRTAGLIASFLYAISPLTIIYGHSSWNPNVVPFFSILLMYSVLKIIVDKKTNWFIILGLTLGVLLQLHYVTFMFLLIIPACFIFTKSKVSFKMLATGFFAFLVTYSPFLLFEIRHNFINTQAVFRFFFTQKNASSGPFFLGFMETAADVTVRLFWRLVIVVNAQLSKLLIVSLLIYYLFQYKKAIKNSFVINKSLLIVIVWLLLGIFSFGLYRGVIYDYYFGSLFVVPFILMGIALTSLWKWRLKGKVLTLLLLIILTIFNLNASPLKIEPNNMLKNTEEIARSIYDRTDSKPYNFALIALRNSDHAYRYFLEVWGKPPTVIENPVTDPLRKTVTRQLLVICEEKVCQPEGHSLWEIAGFGRAQIIDRWDLITVKGFKLVPFTEKKT